MKFKEIYIWEQGLRDINQDAVGIRMFVCNRESYVLGIVCDGIGGLQKGEEASTYIASVLLEKFFSFLEKQKNPPGRQKIKSFLRKEIYCCHRELQMYGERKGIQSGSTLSMFFLKGKKGYWLHSGDSAVYLGKSSFGRIKRFRRISKLHQNEKGQLVQAIGVGEYQKPQIGRFTLGKKDGILLSTDGFYRRLEQDGQIIRNAVGSISKKEFEDMVYKIQKAGEGDNISLLCLIREE